MLSRAAAGRNLRALRVPSGSQTRFASTSHPTGVLRRTVAATIFLASGTLFAAYYFDSRSAVHRYLITPILRQALDAETSHKVAVKVLRSGWGPRDRGVDDERLEVELWGEKLSNPVGLAAGFDKNGEAVDGLLDLGFGWVEVGSITPKPQPGNPQPRVFHLHADSAIINRYGFPSDGAISVLSRLRARLPLSVFDPETKVLRTTLHASLRPNALLAINLGKNKSSPPESIKDFLHGVQLFGPYADVLVVNVSSPNTPGLRGLQSRGMLEELLVGITSARDSLQPSLLTGRRPRVVLKIAPDLNDDQIRDIAAAIRSSPGVDGVIVSNTTIQRPSTLSDPLKAEAGGLSGPPLLPLALHVLGTLRTHLPADIPLIGCGGISSGADALAFARAGASAVQIYTGFGYDGGGACRRIKDELAEELQRTGTTWSKVVKEAVDSLSTTRQRIEAKPAPKTDGTYQDLIKEALSLRDRIDDLSIRMDSS